MKEQVNKIVAELCQIEPSFVGRENDLSLIVAKLLESKPNAKINSRFVSDLRRQLLAMADTAPESHSIKKSKFTFMNKIQFAGLGVIAVLIMALVIYTGSNQSGVRVADFGTPSIKTLSQSAFGSLTLPDGGWPAPNAAIAEGRGAGFGGGGGIGLGAAESTDAMTDDKISVPYEGYTIFRYNYGGSQTSLEQTQMAVYKRVASNLSSVVNGVVKNAGLGLIDTSIFKNAKVRSLSFIDKAGEDWNVYVDFDQGTLNLYREMPYDAQPVPYQPITQDQILPDDQLIALANGAIDRFGIDLQGYGEPKVMDEWKLYYELSTDKENYYFPDYMNVVYPQQINGVTAVEQSGYLEGIMIGIDMRNKRVSSVNNLNIQTFQASDYKIQNDINQLVKNFSDRTQAWERPSDVSIKYIDVELGEPEFVLTKVYRWQNNATDQLYVPAMMFPVISELPDYPYMQRKIVMPLVEELLTY